MKKNLLICLMFGALVMNSAACGTTEKESSSTTTEGETANIDTTSEKEEKNDFDEATNTKITFEEYIFNIPSNWTEGNISSDQYTYYAESGDAVAMFQLQYSDSPAESFDEMYSAKDSYIESFGNSFDAFNTENITAIPILDTEGILFEFTGSTSGLELQGKLLIFINESSNNLITVSMIQSNNTEYSYFNDYEKLLESMEPVPYQDSLTTYPTVTYDDIATGNYNGRKVCIEAVVDKINVPYSTSCSYALWYPSGETYVYSGTVGNSFYEIEENSPEATIQSAQNGDIIKYATQIYADGSFGTSNLEAAEIIGRADIEEVRKAFKTNCTEINYEDMLRNPDNYTDCVCKFTGTIFQIVDESTFSAEYLISTDYGYVYASWYDDEAVRGSRFLENDQVTIYGTFEFLNTYDTLIGANTVPQISVTLMELN